MVSPAYRLTPYLNLTLLPSTPPNIASPPPGTSGPAPASPTPPPADAQASTSSRSPLFVKPRMEASLYFDPQRTSAPEDRLFLPGMFLAFGINADSEFWTRAPSADSPPERGGILNLWGQFRYRSRWQLGLGLDNLPFQLASYVADVGVEAGYQFSNGRTTHSLLVRPFYQHHSNGAERHCLFQPDTWPSRGISSCTVPPGGIDELRARLNREAGDYSSNRVGFSLLWRMWHHGPTPYSLAAGISPEFQMIGAPEVDVLKNLSPEEANLYGYGRFPAFVQGELRRSSYILRGELGAEYHFGSDGRAPAGRFWAEAMVLSPSLSGAGFFLRVNAGRDFQHMFAIDNGFLIHAGVVVDTSAFSRWMSMVR